MDDSGSSNARMAAMGETANTKDYWIAHVHALITTPVFFL